MKYSMLTARYSTTAILLLLQTADFGTGIDAVSIAASAMAIAVSGEMHFCSLADAASDCTPQQVFCLHRRGPQRGWLRF